MIEIRHLPFTLKVAAAVALAAMGSLYAAEPLASATVTRVENQVSYGKVIGDKSETRPATPNDVVKASNFLMSETDSRAELKYEDGTIVRIGQNTIFSFEANTRTLNLKKGTFVFYMPKGKGGGTIKTPSFTAAITGTIGKVSDNIIAIIEGEITLVPSGRKVAEGFFARVNADGSIDILPFDLTKAFDGKLMTFNGPLPGLPALTGPTYEALLAAFQALGIQGSFDNVTNLPSSVLHFTGTQGPTPTPRVNHTPTPTPATPLPATPTATPFVPCLR
ncbi:MAG: FecR family protein [Chthoniobacter sp.]|nr:FecR family protein [Chthoniobacter sp.]